MIEYQKLVTFIYKKNNKRYQILVDNENKFFFMEVNPKTKELSYVNLEDYIDFIQIFCINPPLSMIRKDSKKDNHIKIVPKILMTSGAVILSFSSLCIIMSAVAEFNYNQRLEKYYNTHNIQEEIQRHVSFVIEDKDEKLIIEDSYYNSLINTLFIYDNKCLDEYLGVGDISYNKMITAVDNNDNIATKFKSLFKEYIDALYKKYPQVEKRILYKNLKDLEVVECDKSDLTIKTLSFDSCACYVSKENKIYVLSDYEYKKGTWEYQIIFHEISHALRMSTIKLDTGEEIKIQSSDKTANNIIIDEALNSLFAVSLFDYEEKDIAYQLQSNYFKIMLDCMDNYSLTDYVNHGLTYLASKLDEQNGDTNFATTIFNLIDLQYRDFHSNKIDIEPNEYYPIYNYISNMYFRKYIDNNMSYNEAKKVTTILIDNIMFDVPDEYNINIEVFYKCLDDYCAEIGIVAEYVNVK